MNNMNDVIVPKSDQWNSDDFIAGDMVFKIVGVKIRGGEEQPVSIEVEGSPKVYRPCKSMSRVLVAIWGPDANHYVGRRLRLYRDPDVTWAGMKVGGIRISEMSDIDGGKAVTLALTEKRGQRKPIVIKPLVSAPDPLPKPRLLDAFDLGRAAASMGTVAFREWWNSAAGKDARARGLTVTEEIKRLCAEADERPLDPFGLPELTNEEDR